MPIAPGTVLGHYEVLAPLGAGGMGEVYRARDTRLDREIALKVLPADVCGDFSRRQRFEQEARAASALNHPNILSIYDMGSEGGIAFMVSELVEGESLRAVIERGAVGLRKLLDVAVQVADGLAAAHAAGIVHRDVKPDNLMLNREGRVKILDFGLAKQTSSGAAKDADATLTAAATQTGVILGTVSYMSPEQARGGTLDFRSDQFSFGLVLYELFTGQKAFQRDTAAETMVAILRDEPPIANTPLGTAPPPLRWVVERCLAKDAVERYSHTSDLYRELRCLREHLTETISQSPTKPEAPLPPAHRGRRTGIVAALAAWIAGVIIGLIAVPTDLGMEKYRYVPFATEEGYESGAAWSPDGTTIAYSGEVNGIAQIFTRSLTSPTGVIITKSATACTDPFWSPDGTRIFYLSGAANPGLWSIGVSGGAPESVMPDVYRAALSPDGKTLAFLRFESMDATTLRLGLWLSSPPGATPRKFDRPPISGMRYFHGALQFSPDGAKLGFWMLMWDGEPEFWVIPLPAGQPKQPFLGWKEWVPIDRFRWMPDSRRLLFPYQRPQATGIHLWIADTGSGSLQQVTSGSGNETTPAVSPDGRSVAYTAQERRGSPVQIALEGGMHPLVTGSRNESSVEWSPSGLEYAFVTDRSGVPEIWLAETRTARAWPIVGQKEFGPDINLGFESPVFSPDGQRIAFARYGLGQGKSGAIWIVPVAGGKPVRAVEESEENPQEYPSWSPDGNSIAFANSRSGVVALATAAVGGGARPVIIKEKITASGPQWSPKGNWILYRMPDSLSIISPDGKTDRVLSKQKWSLYTWSVDGSKVYALRTEKRHYTLAAIDVAGGEEKTMSEFDLPSGARLGAGLSMSPDGKSVATTLYQTKGDIWLLEGFQSPGGILRRLWRW